MSLQQHCMNKQQFLKELRLHNKQLFLARCPRLDPSLSGELRKEILREKREVADERTLFFLNNCELFDITLSYDQLKRQFNYHLEKLESSTHNTEETNSVLEVEYNPILFPKRNYSVYRFKRVITKIKK